MKETFEYYFESIEEISSSIKQLKTLPKKIIKQVLVQNSSLKYELIIAKNSLKLILNAVEKTHANESKDQI